jgi:hypothetical protein
MANPRQVQEGLKGHSIQRSQLDTILLALASGEVHWVADPGELFSLPTRASLERSHASERIGWGGFGQFVAHR